MCIAKRRQQSKLTRQKFQNLYGIRHKYSQEHQLSAFLLCTLQFMENTIRKPGISRHFNFLSGNFHHNVHANFQQTFYNLSDSEQLLYYQGIINTLVNNKYVDYKKLHEPQMEFQFDAQVQSFVSNKITTVKVEGSRFLIIAGEHDFDLRNYWLRRSKTKTSSQFVLNAIIGAKIFKFKFRIDEAHDEERKKIKQRLEFIRQQALTSLVREWMIPIKKLKKNLENIQKLNRKKSDLKISQKMKMFDEVDSSDPKKKSFQKISYIECSPIFNSQINKCQNGLKKKRSIINQKNIEDDVSPYKINIEINKEKDNQSKMNKQLPNRQIPLSDLLEITALQLQNQHKKNQQPVKFHNKENADEEKQSELSLSRFGNLEYITNSEENLSKTEFYSMKQNSVKFDKVMTKL